jgi:hypothetical protein
MTPGNHATAPGSLYTGTNQPANLADCIAVYNGRLMALDRAIADVVGDSNSDVRELVRCLRRAIDLRGFWNLTDRQATLPDLVLHRARIHDAFGAPGGWGYDHPVGQALQSLYAMDFRKERTR